MHVRHDYTDTSISFSPEGQYLAFLSQVKRTKHDADLTLLESEARMTQSYANAARLTDVTGHTVTFSEHPDHCLIEVSVFDLIAGGKIVTTILSEFRTITLKVTDDEVQLTGFLRLTGTILLYKLNLSGLDEWYQQGVMNMPSHIMNDKAMNVTRLKDSAESLTLLVGYWPYPNNWPRPDLGDHPIPQPVIIQIPGQKCDSWSYLPNKIIKFYKDGAHRTHKRFKIYAGTGGSDLSSAPDADITPATDPRALELAIIAHEFQTGDEKVNDQSLKVKLEQKLPEVVPALRPASYVVPDECQVCHSFPWVASSEHEGDFAPYSSGLVDGYRFESIRTRMRSVIEGTAKELWMPWWSKWEAV